jgi:hypothetical protein
VTSGVPFPCELVPSCRLRECAYQSSMSSGQYGRVQTNFCVITMRLHAPIKWPPKSKGTTLHSQKGLVGMERGQYRLIGTGRNRPLGNSNPASQAKRDGQPYWLRCVARAGSKLPGAVTLSQATAMFRHTASILRNVLRYALGALTFSCRDVWKTVQYSSVGFPGTAPKEK